MDERLDAPVHLTGAEPGPSRRSDNGVEDSLAFDWRPLLAAAAVGLTYYFGARVGLALTFEPFPLAILWPPNALLLAALALAPVRWWWLLLAAALPAHLLAELPAGVPLTMVACWFVSNCCEALIGAVILRRATRQAPGLDSARAVTALCLAAATGALLSSFLDAGFVRMVGWGTSDFWALWKSRVFTNALSTLMFVPVAVTWASLDVSRLLAGGRARLLEGVVLVAGLLFVAMFAFDTSIDDAANAPGMLYLPVPFLVWMALRFGPPMTSVSFTIVAALVTWGACQGRGPFLHAVRHDDVLSIQVFLIGLGVPLLFLAAVIEERSRAQRRVRASQELFATAFHSSPDAIAINRRRDGRVLEANDVWLSMLRYGRDDLAEGRVAPLERHVDPGDRPKLAGVVQSGRSLRDVELKLTDSQGHVRYAVVAMTAVDLLGEPCTISIVRDITAQRRAENEAREQRQQLTHLTRVASLTSFAGTLAHELNQPLTAILSNAQAAVRFLGREPLNVGELRSILTEIADADKRAGLLIHRLRTLMKKGTEEFALIDLNQLVREVLEFVHGEFVTYDVEIASSLSAELPPVNGDRIQLQQLVLNLISNACEAMRHQQRLPRKLSVSTVQGFDDTVQLVVSDTGPGIPSDVIGRIFEPFFTTKETGLGLGLSISRTIAHAHHGSLIAQSHHGETGATFRLLLPNARRSRNAMTRASDTSLHS
jgi:PAS domain S-box-containing protein